MRSEAQKRADTAYAKKKIRVVLEFNEELAEDMDLLNWIASQKDGKTATIKRLIKDAKDQQ